MFKLDVARHSELVRRVAFSSRECSDGLCCFLTEGASKTLRVQTNPDMTLVRKTYTPGYQVYDLIHGEGITQACEYLDLATEVKDGVLTLEFRCKIYENRPQKCQTHPGEGNSCIYSARRTLLYHFFLTFPKENHPEAEGFAYDAGSRIISVPVPIIKI